MQEANYRTTVVNNLSEISSAQWEQLRQCDASDNPFLSYHWLRALEQSGCACSATGWGTYFLTVWLGDALQAAMPMYLKMHSYGEYVFDWSWANAFQQHQVPYYPKLLSAIPFTPVTGPRLLAVNQEAMQVLVQALIALNAGSHASSCHILFLPEQQARRLQDAGFMLRQGVQFHWVNQGYRDFDDFLTRLESKKRKNILAERRKVRDKNIRFKHKVGRQISPLDWEFFYRCYQNTYNQHGGQGYLNLEFFLQIHDTMPENILMITASRDEMGSEIPIAASLLILNADTVFGRYWGSVEYHPCLHFETAYYQPLEFCIANQIHYFEGGAQGEHKMARGFLPQTTYSAHHINHPAFAEAIQRFLNREQSGMVEYMNELNEHNPFGRPDKNTIQSAG